MKVLILSITAGQGHHATGNAIQAEFKDMGVESTMVDAYEYVVPPLKEAVAKAYILSTAYAPRLSGNLYDFVVKKKEPVPNYSFLKITHTAIARGLIDYINLYNPNVIICTHVISAAMVNILLERKEINTLTVGIVTDFTLHPYWEDAAGLDYFVTPHELLEYQLMQKGISVDKMLPFGIPILPKFSKCMPKKKARELLDLDPNMLTLLIMSGSMGYGKIDKSIEKVDKLEFDIQGLVICGNNKKIYKKVKSLKTKNNFHIYEYVDNIDIMMDAADCIITKPGGITSSESLAKGLPMIMINPIPGHEHRNVEFMLNNGVALYASKSAQLDEIVFSLIKFPQRLKHFKQTINLYAKKNSTKVLCEFLIEKVNGAK